MLRILRQQPAECLEAVDQSFGVIETIDTQRQRTAAQALLQSHGLRAVRGLHRSLGEPLCVYADRIDDGTNVAAIMHEAAFVDPGNRKNLANAVQECSLIRGRVEANDVEGTHCLQHFRRARQNVQQGRRNKRRMQKKSETVAHTQPAQFLGEREQVVIMHPNEVIRAQQSRDRFGELAVDRTVSLVILAPIFHQAETKVQQWPQHPVRKRYVESAVFSLAQIDRCVADPL
jgi:hypothetical protein